MEIMNEEEAEFEEDTTPEQSPPQNLGIEHDHHSFLFGYSSADVDLTGLHPLPAQGSFLWQIYLENIEPLVKVLHIPTMSRLMTQVRRGEHDLRPGDEALVFAIYYSAVTSMETQEVSLRSHNFTSYGRRLTYSRLKQISARLNLTSYLNFASLLNKL
jgi:hypothetical protein